MKNQKESRDRGKGIRGGWLIVHGLMAIMMLACSLVGNTTATPDIEPTLTARPAPTTQVIPAVVKIEKADECMIVIADESVNVRGDPDYEDGPIEGWLLAGELVHVFGSTTDEGGNLWISVWNREVEGWVSGLYLAPAECP